MADGKKTFIIEINGIQESLNAVESLNKQLDDLEKRIGNLSKRNINISASGGASKELDAEEKLRRQIINQEDKIIGARKDEYQILLQQKSEFKQINELQKKNLAQANLEGKAYENTMQGMKTRLADIKTVLHNTDLGDTQSINKLTTEANELTNKLKEMEQAYGTFGRNVGNYANGVAEGMSKIVIKVGETEREFNNAREASRTLNMELKTMALNGEQNTQEYKDLNNAVKQMNSTLKDVEVSSVAMDNLLDTMQGIVAVASTAKGIGALFGMDDGAIDETIQKLVALQNVLQGLEVIRKQMQTQEGIGLLLSKGNKAVDNMVKSIIGIETASKGATIATKALSVALKSIGVGLAIAGVVALISYLDKYVKKTEEAKKAAEEFGKEQDKAATKTHMAKVEMENTLQTLMTFNGTKEEEKKIVEDLNSKYGKAIGNYKTLSEWKTALINKTSAYAEVLGLEAKMAAAASLAQKHYQEQMEAQRKGDMKTASGASIYAEYYENQMYDIQKEINRINRKYKINSFAPSDDDNRKTKTKIRESGNKAAEAMKEAQNNINELKLKIMREGLRKELAQLDEENRKEIEKIRKNGQKVEEQLLLQERNYQEQRKRILQEYANETLDIMDETTARNIQTEIDKVDNALDRLGRKMNVTFNEPKSTMDDFMKRLNGIKSTIQEYYAVLTANALRKNLFNYQADEMKSTNPLNMAMSPDDAFAEFVLTNDKLRGKILDYFKKEYALTDEELQEFLPDINQIKEAYDKVFSELSSLVSEYGQVEEINGVYLKSLSYSMQDRMEITRGAYKEMLKAEQEYYRQRGDLQKRALAEEERVAEDDIQKKINDTLAQFDELRKLDEQTRNLDNGSAQEYYRDLMEENRDTYTEMEKEGIAYVRRLDALYDQLNSIIDQYTERRKKIETDTLKDIAASENKLFDQRIKDYDDYLQKIRSDMSSLPTTNKWGFTDLKGLKKSIGEITQATTLMRQYVQTDIDQVNDDFRNGLITEEDKNRVLASLRSVFGAIDDVTKETDNKIREGAERRKREINEMIQIVGQAATQIIQSIGEINQAAFERQLEAIEKQTDLLEKQLDKQRELTEKYKDDVDSIEDELATARGDRRQHLIDQLNAQMEAQRQSLAQEKQMEKEREKLEKKREKLEYENEMRKWNQSKQTAAINAALSISAAAVNSWPIPAIPMIAAATLMGAAQMAAVIANKPRKYADGGLLQGRSHAQGGIPVGNTGIEVEGKEYIINKRTTMQNVDVLDLINSKKRKLTLDDFIDFYSKGSKVSRNVSSMRTRFADGGELPTLRTDIELNSRLVDTMERYAERPSVVQVVDIINKTDEVKRVQTLAGLS